MPPTLQLVTKTTFVDVAVMMAGVMKLGKAKSEFGAMGRRWE